MSKEEEGRLATSSFAAYDEEEEEEEDKEVGDMDEGDEER